MLEQGKRWDSSLLSSCNSMPNASLTDFQLIQLYSYLQKAYTKIISQCNVLHNFILISLVIVREVYLYKKIVFSVVYSI